jgi:putative hydrolase of the HAD superfamily
MTEHQKPANIPGRQPDSILFDLDGTLYSARMGLEQQVNLRVNEYIAGYLSLPLKEAWNLRKKEIVRGGYGTTLEWLLAEKDFNPSLIEGYFAFIHPEHETTGLEPDPFLRPFLLSLSETCKLAILTNSPAEHAHRMLKKLGVDDLFPSIFDIRSNGLKGKPYPEAFYRALEELKSSPERCLFVDDVRLYVEGYRAIGGTGILFDEFDEHRDFPSPRIFKLDELAGMIGL